MDVLKEFEREQRRAKFVLILLILGVIFAMILSSVITAAIFTFCGVQLG